MVAVARRIQTVEEYLDFEYNSTTRHEYINGKIIAMPYTTKNHGRVASNLNRHLGNCLDETSYEVYNESRMLHIPQCTKFYYPDLIIVPLDADTYIHKQKMEADLFPVSLIEVLSESTEGTDKEAKWKCYQKIETLREYVLVSQFEKFVQVYVRSNENPVEWKYTSYSEEEETVPIFNCQISVKDIYKRVELPTAEHKSDS